MAEEFGGVQKDFMRDYIRHINKADSDGERGANDKARVSTYR